MSVVMFKDMMMNQTKVLVTPDVSGRRVTANAVLVQPNEVRVDVARLLRRIITLGRSDALRSQQCRPSPKSTARAVVRLFVIRIVTWRWSVMQGSLGECYSDETKHTPRRLSRCSRPTRGPGG
jgi:hypothetical protein